MPDSNVARKMNIAIDKATSKSKLPGRVVPYADLARSAAFSSSTATGHQLRQESQQPLGVIKTTVVPHSRIDLQIPERRKKLENLKMQRMQRQDYVMIQEDLRADECSWGADPDWKIEKAKEEVDKAKKSILEHWVDDCRRGRPSRIPAPTASASTEQKLPISADARLRLSHESMDTARSRTVLRLPRGGSEINPARTIDSQLNKNITSSARSQRLDEQVSQLERHQRACTRCRESESKEDVTLCETGLQLQMKCREIRESEEVASTR